MNSAVKRYRCDIESWCEIGGFAQCGKARERHVAHIWVAQYLAMEIIIKAIHAIS